MRGRWAPSGSTALASTLLVLVVVLSACSGARPPGGPVDNRLGMGFTHTQTDLDPSRPGAARVLAALSAQPMAQAQAIMGWGADNPEPAPGRFDFASLDRRVDLMRRTGATPVLVLCCAPDWMKGGRAGETDWSRLEVAPTADHRDDFAALAAEVARRYPDVRHFLVWNEFKGFFDESTKTWDGAAYTDLYNRVYDALKDVDPSNQVGGPYIEMGAPPPGAETPPSSLSGPWGEVDPRSLAAFEYWDRHKAGADFVVVDGHATVQEGAPDEITALDKFSAVDRWIRARTDLPIWWAEWYVETEDSGWSTDKQIAMRAAAMVEMVRSGTDTALYWNSGPPGAEATELWGAAPGDEALAPGPLLDVVAQFDRWFPPGTTRTDPDVPAPVRALAQPRMTLLVNPADAPVTVTVEGTATELGPYEVRWVPRGA